MVDWDGYATARTERDGYDPRRAAAVVCGWFRLGYEIGRGLRVLRVPPEAASAAGVVLAALVPLAAVRGAGGLLAAAGLALLSGLAHTVARALDLLAPDPGVPRRAVWQAAAERAAELGWLVGFWVAGVPGPLVAACGALTGLHELVRGQALAAGASRLGAQTVAERPMRATVAVAGLALAGLGGSVGPLGSGVLTVAAVVWLLLALLGAGQLAAVVHKSLR